MQSDIVNCFSMRTIFFSPDPPADQGPAPAPAPEPANPPAADLVLKGKKTEREVALESDLETERNSHAKTSKEKKERELRIAELEDELHRLKTPPAKARRLLPDISEFFED